MAGPGFKVADGFIEIHADIDRGELQRDIQAGVASISRAARTINLVVDLDRAEVIQKVSSALSKIPRVARMVELLVDVDRTRITAAIESVIQRIPRFARTIELLVDIDVLELARKIEIAIRMIPPAARTITVNVDLDMGAALTQLAGLRALLGGLGGSGTGSIGGLSSSFAGLATNLGMVVLVAGALFAALTLLPPVIGLAIGAVGVLTTAMFGMVGVGAAVVLGMRGMSEALKQAATTGQVTAEALKGLTPAAQSFVLALRPAHGLLQAFGKIAQENLFRALDLVLSAAIRSLGVLGPFIGEIAIGLNKVAAFMLAAFASPRNVEMLASIFSFMADALLRMAHVFPNIYNALLRIGESAGSVFVRLADKIVDVSEAFQAWIVDLDGNALDEFFTLAAREAKGLLDVVGGLIIVTGKFLGAFFPGVDAGSASMSGLVAKLDEISAWLDDGRNLVILRDWTEGFLNAGRAVLDFAGTVINAIGTVVAYLANNREVLVGALAVLGIAAATAGGLWAAGMAGAAAATIAATWPVYAVAAALAAMVAAVTFAYKNWDTFREAVDGALSWLRENGPPIFESIKQHVIELYDTALAPLVGYIRENGEAFANIGKVLLVVGGIIVGAVLVALTALVAGSLAVTAAAAALVVGVTALVAVLYNFAQVLWDAFGNARDFLGGVIEAIEDFVGKIPGFLGGVVEAVEGFFASLWAAVSAVPERIGGLIDPVEATIAGFVANVVQWFTELPGRIAAGFAAAPGVLYAAIVTVFDTVTYAIGYAVGTIVKFFIDLPGRIMETAAALWATVTTVFTVAKDTAVNVTVAALDAVVGFFIALPGRVWGALVAVWGVVTDIFTTTTRIAVDTTVSLINTVTDFFAQLPGRAAGAVSSLWGAISGAFFSAKDQATSTAVSTVDNVTGWLSSLPGRAAGALSGFGGAVAGALSSAVGSAYNIGRDIVQGVANGISSATGFVIDAAKRAAGNIIRGFKDALGISSPSKVMAMQVGKWIPAGIEVGVDRAMPALEGAINAAINAMVDVRPVPFDRALTPVAATPPPIGATGSVAHLTHNHFAAGSVVVDGSKIRSQEDFDRMFEVILRRFGTAARTMVAAR